MYSRALKMLSCVSRQSVRNERHLVRIAGSSRDLETTDLLVIKYPFPSSPSCVPTDPEAPC